ncbi:PD40 domain-containing protein [bacterium]|nr:PD40 domain-containing protein [bacterium]
MKRKSLLLFVLIGSLCLFSCGKKEENPSSLSSLTNMKPQTSFEGQIIFQSNADGDNEIYLMSGEKIKKLTDNSWDDRYPVWSPDGDQIAFYANPQGNYDIYLMNSDGSGVTRLTSSPATEKTPAWFNDGQGLVFARSQKKLIRKKTFLFRIDIQSGKTKRLIPDSDQTQSIPNVSPKAPVITFTGKRTLGWDVALYHLKEKKVQFLHEGGKSCRARFSPDGQKLVYVSSQADGKGDIWLMNPDGSDKKRLTHRDETYDYFPSWSPDGGTIVFNSSHQHDHDGDWKLYLLDVSTGKTSLLFDSPGSDIFPDWYGIQ